MSNITASIFHTNDIHGRIERFSRLISLVRELREEAKEEGITTFFFDAGDAVDRDVNICGITKGAAFTEIMNAAGYDLQTMGNAISLPYGVEALSKAAVRVDYPVLGANFRNKNGQLPEGLSESAAFQVNENVKIGVTGFTAPLKGMYEFYGMCLPDVLEEAERQVKKLKDEGATVIIILSHLGLKSDRRLARGIPGIDLIIGGHSHILLEEGQQCENTLITQAGCYAEGAGRIDINLDSETGNIIDMKASYIRIPENRGSDRLIDEAIKRAELEAQKISETSIGRLDAPLNHDYFNECGIGDMAADALKEYMKADAAIVLSGLLSDSLERGNITLGDLNRACFTGANPCVSRVSGETIYKALEKSLDREKMHSRPKSYRGNPLGVLQISGMTVALSKNDAGISRIMIDGKELNPAAEYRLAHTDAETVDSECLEIENPENTEQEVPTILREVIQKYFENRESVPAPEQGRWIETD